MKRLILYRIIQCLSALANVLFLTFTNNSLSPINKCNFLKRFFLLIILDSSADNRKIHVQHRPVSEIDFMGLHCHRHDGHQEESPRHEC
ncbi:hypothetical protein BDF14DRAFT_1865957 [Spinellus fusiger]|nr:hypothetical protein BDF14DRAFT_1865957 [Spinellus fusiger]